MLTDRQLNVSVISFTAQKVLCSTIHRSPYNSLRFYRAAWNADAV